MMEIWLVAGVAVVVAVGAYALLNRRGGEVIDAPRQAQSSAAAPPPATRGGENFTAGDMLERDGMDPNDPVCHLAAWLELEATEELGTAVEEQGAVRRIADAARAVMPVVLAQGRGTVDLPGLALGRGFRREIDVAQLERAVVDSGLLDERELADWRRDPPPVKALAVWLAEQINDEQPENAHIADDKPAYVVAAARRAIDDVGRTGRADIVLTSIGKDAADRPFDVCRSVDAEVLQSIVTQFESDEPATMRTR